MGEMARGASLGIPKSAITNGLRPEKEAKVVRKIKVADHIDSEGTFFDRGYRSVVKNQVRLSFGPLDFGSNKLDSTRQDKRFSGGSRQIFGHGGQRIESAYRLKVDSAFFDESATLPPVLQLEHEVYRLTGNEIVPFDRNSLQRDGSTLTLYESPCLEDSDHAQHGSEFFDWLELVRPCYWRSQYIPKAFSVIGSLVFCLLVFCAAIVLHTRWGLLVGLGIFGALWLSSKFPHALVAPLNSCPENVRVLPVIIPELELGNIEGHVFPADLVERTDDTPLNALLKECRRTP
jgi:hypothetical protein